MDGADEEKRHRRLLINHARHRHQLRKDRHRQFEHDRAAKHRQQRRNRQQHQRFQPADKQPARAFEQGQHHENRANRQEQCQADARCHQQAHRAQQQQHRAQPHHALRRKGIDILDLTSRLLEREEHHIEFLREGVSRRAATACQDAGHFVGRADHQVVEKALIGNKTGGKCQHQPQRDHLGQQRAHRQVRTPQHQRNRKEADIEHQHQCERKGQLAIAAEQPVERLFRNIGGDAIDSLQRAGNACAHIINRAVAAGSHSAACCIGAPS